MGALPHSLADSSHLDHVVKKKKKINGITILFTPTFQLPDPWIQGPGPRVQDPGFSIPHPALPVTVDIPAL